MTRFDVFQLLLSLIINVALVASAFSLGVYWGKRQKDTKKSEVDPGGTK